MNLRSGLSACAITLFIAVVAPPTMAQIVQAPDNTHLSDLAGYGSDTSGYVYSLGGTDGHSNTWTPGLTGTYQVEVQWGVYPSSHSTNVDFSFDPDGAGAAPASAVLSDVNERFFADGTPGTATDHGRLSGYKLLTGTYDLTSTSTFPVNSVAGATDGNITFASWRFTAVPEPTSLSLCGLGGLLLIRRRRA